MGFELVNVPILEIRLQLIEDYPLRRFQRPFKLQTKDNW